MTKNNEIQTLIRELFRLTAKLNLYVSSSNYDITKIIDKANEIYTLSEELLSTLHDTQN